MDAVLDFGTAFLWGMFDSFKGTVTVFRYERELKRRENEKRVSPTYSSSPIRHRQSQSREHTPLRNKKNKDQSILNTIAWCGGLNGIGFAVTVALFDYAIMPFLSFFIIRAFGFSFWQGLEYYLSLTFQSIWVVPFSGLVRMINSLWFQDIGQTAFKRSRGRSNVSLGLSKTIADFIFSSAVEALFLIQAKMMTCVPISYLGEALYFGHMSLLYSLYAFEYIWTEMGWEIHTRLNCVETHWPYFLGFGLPLSLCAHLTDSWIINGCIFSVLFPVLIVSASEANPTVKSCTRLKIFSPVIKIANAAFTTLSKEKKMTVQRLASQPRR